MPMFICSPCLNGKHRDCNAVACRCYSCRVPHKCIVADDGKCKLCGRIPIDKLHTQLDKGDIVKKKVMTVEEALKEVTRLLGKRARILLKDGKCMIGEITDDNMLVTVLAEEDTWEKSIAEVKKYL